MRKEESKAMKGNTEIRERSLIKCSWRNAEIELGVGGFPGKQFWEVIEKKRGKKRDNRRWE